MWPLSYELWGRKDHGAGRNRGGAQASQAAGLWRGSASAGWSKRGIMGNGRPWGRIYPIYLCAGPVDFVFLYPKASRLVCFVQALVLSVTLYLLVFRTCLFATLYCTLPWGYWEDAYHSFFVIFCGTQITMIIKSLDFFVYEIVL